MKAPLRVLALAPYPETGPSTRFRLAQFVEPLAERGIELSLRPFLSLSEYEARYGEPGVWWKVRATLRGLGRRLRDLRDAESRDAVIVHRELSPVGNGLLRSELVRRGVPYLYDFDDAVFLPAPGSDPLLGRIRRPRSETAALCRDARLVLAGNDFLADFARRARRGSRDGVEVLPTVIDTERFRPDGNGRSSPPVSETGSSEGGSERVPVVGWIGTHSTMPNLEALLPVLDELATRVRFRLRVVSNRRPSETPSRFELEFRRWSADREVEETRELDVGLYPLEDDPWNRGKCGFKAIQYLACGIPVVASPVGVIRQIVVPGRTGFHAETDDEWLGHLEELLRDPGLRRRLGREGRRHVEEEYSVGAVVETLARRIRDAAGVGAGTAEG